MPRMRALGVLALALGCASWAFPAGKVESSGPFSGTAAESIKAALAPSGLKLTLSDGTAAGEIWFAKDAAGLTQGAFFGVLSLAKPSEDCRGQEIPAGTYTLRYSKMPEDGNHSGAAPTTDFLLVSPIADDTDAAAKPAFMTLFKQSAKTAGGGHGVALNLTDVGTQEQFPALTQNDHKQEVLYAKVKVAGSDLPIALVLKGKYED
jgi:hypothetical protein